MIPTAIGARSCSNSPPNVPSPDRHPEFLIGFVIEAEAVSYLLHVAVVDVYLIFAGLALGVGCSAALLPDNAVNIFDQIDRAVKLGRFKLVDTRFNRACYR
jgi:hypothetical protein